MKHFYSLSICLFLLSFAMQAQEVVFTTRVQANKMGTQDVITVQYELQNAQQIDDFQFKGNAKGDYRGNNDFKAIGQPSQGTTMNIMNGETKLSVIITFKFQPRRTGRLNFPVAVARLGRRKYETNPVSIDVVKGSLARQQQSRDPFFNQDPFADLRRMQEELARRAQQRSGMSSNGATQPGRRVEPNRRPNGSPIASTAVTKENIYDNLFIRVAVDKKEVKVGEQITATYKLYTRVPINVNLEKLPNLNNFWKEEFEIPFPFKPKREFLNGIEYQVFLIRKTALFPTKSGDLVLDPAKAKGTAKIRKLTKVRKKSPLAEFFEDDPFFKQGFGSLLMDDPRFNDSYFNEYEYEEVPVTVPSQPVNIRVTELPEEEKPNAFKGAVGKFSLESKLSAAEITTDDVASLTLTIRGTGNIKLIDPPILNLPKSVEIFEPVEFDTITNKVNNSITGYKRIKYSFTPQSTGVLKIPSMTFAYYNAKAERYEVKTTPEYSVLVKPGVKKKNTVILPMDIHDIMAENSRLGNENATVLPEQIWYWGAYLIPTFGFLFLLGFKRKEESERKDTVRFKNKRANRVALKRLEKAEQHRKGNEKTKFYEETAKAVWLYLSDKLNIPLATLSKEMAGTLLRQREISQDIIDELYLITDECELALYSPDAGDFKMNQVYSDSLKIIGTLEDKLSS